MFLEDLRKVKVNFLVEDWGKEKCKEKELGKIQMLNGIVKGNIINTNLSI